MRRWLAQQGREEELRQWQAANAREAQFARLLRETRRRLERLYRSDLDEAATRIEKQREFGRLEFEYERLRASWAGYGGFDGWFQRTLNNAHLASVATYRDCMPGLERELAESGSLPAFYERARALAELPARERARTLCVVVRPGDE